ncbi:MAG TPA: hypothetical protein VGM06_06310 [Polyangiaceae bacterium]|jgi:hypothetical protein
MDSTSTIDPDAGPPAPMDGGENCTTNLNGCSYMQSCSDADDAGDSDSISVSYTVAGDGTISGTESVNINIAIQGLSLNEMCTYTVTGTKVN